MEKKKYRSGRDSERTESGKQSRTTESGKRVCRRKNNCGKWPGSFEGYGRKGPEKTEKSPESILQKTIMRDLKKFNRKKKQ